MHGGILHADDRIKRRDLGCERVLIGDRIDRFIQVNGGAVRAKTDLNPLVLGFGVGWKF